ncbi:hypothetical protein VOLCADRAFT_66018 [Volvox carteri f. nagariensis]|uniref:ASCH domain-containing protein n=1 Tax=Volvox carteri f. nagariensis TaxID=3068 RepID=D8UA44_VOLCA|nr:uncharacterized protein VOLCADRAFT_66018 [Volvox carteri f. nagariensis]EFJ43360.1 hypothetical protein VOLCADRAFT_66018 [Volvox carteri f. nagariensis]|eukprot:XP_002955507.1 hypothetical protein VOLCADRAFT_66018 [Volvox carteri f. nagariensis]
MDAAPQPSPNPSASTAATATTTAARPAAATRRQPLSRDSSLMPRYLELIRSGTKTVEGRIRAGKWADVIPGDIFRFFSTQAPPSSTLPANTNTNSVSVRCRAITVRQYDSFQAMLEGEGLAACLPGVQSLEEGVEVYRSIPGYREREAVEGVVAVGLELLLTDDC